MHIIPQLPIVMVLSQFIVLDANEQVWSYCYTWCSMIQYWGHCYKGRQCITGPLNHMESCAYTHQRSCVFKQSITPPLHCSTHTCTTPLAPFHPHMYEVTWVSDGWMYKPFCQGRSEANDCGLFEIPRYLYIIYMSVCWWIAQDRAHLMQVLSRRPIVHCPSKHWLLFGAPLWGVAFSIGMADGAISAEDSPDDDSDLSRMRTQEAPGRWQRLGPYSYRYRTQEAQLKPDCRTEGRRIGSRTTSAYSFLYYFFLLYMYLSLYIISLLSVYSNFWRIFSLLLLLFQIHKLLHA